MDLSVKDECKKRWSQEIPAFYGALRFITVFIRAHYSTILSQMDQQKGAGKE